MLRTCHALMFGVPNPAPLFDIPKFPGDFPVGHRIAKTFTQMVRLPINQAMVVGACWEGGVARTLR